MKRNVQYLVLSAFVLFSMGACAVNKAIPLDKGFWDDKLPVVGVALASLPEPEVTVKIFSTTPFGRPKTLIMSSRYDQDFDEEPYILRDQRHLWHYLNSHEMKEVTELKDIFTQGLASRGFRVVTIDEKIDLKGIPRYTPSESGHARRDYRGIYRVQGLDLLIVLNVMRYGTYCGYLDGHNIFTDVTATITGEMVDLKTNRILWRSKYMAGRQQGSASTRCDDPGTYSQIIKDLGSAFVESAVNVSNDFFSGSSN